MKSLLFASIPLVFLVMLVGSFDGSSDNHLVFAMHGMSHHDDDQQKNMMMSNTMKGSHMSDGHHHMSYNGMCAPGFAALNGMCVLDDRCGPGAYPGKMCMMDGVLKEYLRPHHQKHAGLSAQNIICAEGKQLIFKQSDASPACVLSDSVKKLESRGGWHTQMPVLACTMQYDPVCGVDGVTYGNMCALNSSHMAVKHLGECKNMMQSIDSFEECVAAGNPVMESHPRQCRTDDGKHFVEKIDNDENERKTILYVDSKLVDCVGIGPQQCMLVKENLDDEWEFFYQSIAGFEYEEGISYKIHVSITQVENPSTDGSSLKYALLEILEP